MTFKHDENKLSYFDTAKKNDMVFPLLAKYFETMEDENSKTSLSGYKDSISRFLIYFDIHSISDIELIEFDSDKVIGCDNNGVKKFNSLIAFQKYLFKSGLRYTSVNTHILRVKAFWDNMIYGEKVKNLIIKKLKQMKKPHSDIKDDSIFAFTREEEEAMINSYKDIHKKLMLTLMFKRGMRRSEIASILISNIDFSENSIHIVGKGNKPAEFPLNDDMMNLLKESLKQRNSSSPYLFYTAKGPKGNDDKLSGNAVNDTVVKAAKAIGISEERLKRVSAHKTRSTFVTNVVEDYGIYVGRDLARHNSVKTTEIYADVRKETIKNAYLNIK